MNTKQLLQNLFVLQNFLIHSCIALRVRNVHIAPMEMDLATAVLWIVSKRESICFSSHEM